MTVRAILFDFGGTLDSPNHWLDRFAACYRAYGLTLTRYELAPSFDHATRKAYGATEAMRSLGLQDTLDFLVSAQLEHLKCLGPEHVRSRLEQIGASGVVDLRNRVGAAFACECRRGLSISREILRSLRSRYRIGVVSNFYGNLDRVLAEAGMLELMDVTVDSAAAGIFKPDPELFHRALALLGSAIQPETVAMVGDSPDKDCLAARRAGLKAIWFCCPADRAAPGSLREFADHKIHALEELLQLQWATI